jgi:hypothetical protein
MSLSRFHTTMSSHAPIFVGAQWFSVHRVGDTPDGVHCVEIVTKQPGTWFLTSLPLHENERCEVFPGVFIACS